MRHRRGQSTAEYAVMLGVVLTALVAMQVYIKRGAQGRVKLGVDEFTRAGTGNVGWIDDDAVATGDVKLSRDQAQYEPYYAESDYTVSRQSTEEEDIKLAQGKITRKIPEAETDREKTTRKAVGFQRQRTWNDAD